MDFIGEIATIQQRLAACQEMAARRHAVLQELAPRRGERVIEVGCGAGFLLREIGLALGPHGLAAGVDISEDQIAAAARECAHVPAVKPMVGDIRVLDYPDEVFDAAVAVQVVEYIEDVPGALTELRRVLKPGGRFHCLATNWDSAFWHGPEATLTAQIARAWDAHAPWPNLPARLPPMLVTAGFGSIRTLPVPVVNPNLHENTFAYWAARLMAAYAVEQGVDKAQAQAWLDALDEAEQADEFFFSSVPILTTAIAV
ncbi:MAG: methyltransferase domain-containing protein [Paracoccaceae bacterium]|nr:methyltransferase domain-containing protein [Paracoccaceae bacterium]